MFTEKIDPICIMFFVACLSTGNLRTVRAQSSDQYATLVAQAKSDVNSGNAAKALEEAQRAEKLNPRPWQALLIAGAAQESLKQYHEAANDFADALLNAPEDKKAPIQVLFEKCRKEESEASKAETNSSGPTLEVTMQFIQEKLGDIGRVAFIQFGRDANNGNSWSNSWTNEVTNVVADPNQCHLSFHWKATKNGSTTIETEGRIDFRNVQKFAVKPFSQFQTEQDAAAGNPNIITPSTSPPMTALEVFEQRGPLGQFPFTDSTMADRVAKALTHAVQLCGGGNKEPF